MQSQTLFVPAGTVSPVFQMNATTSVCIGPQVLGGTTQLEIAPTNNGPWSVFATAQANPFSFRPALPINSQYGRVTATTQQAIAHITDFGGANGPQVDEMLSFSATLASASSAAEQIIYSFRVPPLFLPLSWRMELQGNVAYSANANAKTMQVRVNGLAGTLIHQSAAIGGGTNANYNWQATCVGDGTGQNIKGFGVGATSGLGVSTVAYTALARDFINNETEIVVTCTKTTAGDTFTIEGLRVTLFV